MQVDSADGLRDRFLNVLARVGARAARTDARVVVFLCGPANLRQDLLVGPVVGEESEAQGRERVMEKGGRYG